MNPQTDIDLLRHALATLAYRGGKAIRTASADFGTFKPSPKSRTPAEILAHIGDILEWALTMMDGKPKWHDAAPLPWEQEIARFFRILESLDSRLADGRPLANSSAKIFQGPIADAFTHVGQISLLRGISGSSVKAENYYTAEIKIGRVGSDQAAPVREF